MKKNEFWDLVVQELSSGKRIKELSLKAWIRPLKILHVANGIVLLKVADSFAYDFISKQYGEQILAAAQAVDSAITEIRFTTEDSVPIPKPTEQVEEKEKPQKKTPVKAVPKQEAAQFQHPLNPKFSFDTFIAGYDNSFALKSSVAVAESPGDNRFSPLFIYSGVGLGKSHLLHAIGNTIKKQRPKFKVVLTTAEEFFYNYSAALGKKPKDNGKEYGHFFNLFTQCDVLLIDEIQHLSGKNQCQIDFFRIFNELHRRGTLMVFTGDRAPEKLLGFEERLISRLQWGLAVEIQEPLIETKMAILSEFALREKLDLSAEVISFIAEHGPGNIRELEGIIIKLLVQASLVKVDIDLKTAEAALNQRLLTEEQKFSVDRIIGFCCDHFGVATKLLLGKGRSKEVALCRQVGMYIAKKHTSFSLKAIGLEFGGRDHSTVVHAVKAIEKRLKSEEDLSKDVETILKELSK